MNGNGYVAFDYLITALLWLATVMQAAVVRDRSITETEFADSCRWLIVAGTAGLAARFTFVLIDTGDIRLPPMSLVSIGVLCVGLIGGPLERLTRPPRNRRSTDWAELDDMETAHE